MKGRNKHTMRALALLSEIRTQSNGTKLQHGEPPVRTQQGFRVGRRYALAPDKLALLPDDVQPLIDRSRGVQFQGERTWVMWRIDLRTVTVLMTADAKAIESHSISKTPDEAAPAPMR